MAITVGWSYGDTQHRARRVRGEMTDNLPMLLTKWAPWAAPPITLDPDYDPTPLTATAIVAGKDSHTCALLDDGGDSGRC